MAECISINSDLPKQDCSSPSPTETVCLESLCAENNPSTSQSNTEQLSNLQIDNYNIDQVEKLEKNNFLNELGLVEECEDGVGDNEGTDDDDDDTNSKDDNWEDCLDQEFPDDNSEDVTSNEETSIDNITQSNTPKSTQSKRNYFGAIERILRKRKLDVNNGLSLSLPCKRIQCDSSNLCSDGASATPTNSSCSSQSFSGSITPASGRSRATIPTKDNPPPDLSIWLNRFTTWSNAERIMAINELIASCEPTQVRHMMQVIEPQFQRDFISLLPKELALKVLSFLEPKDLLRAAQTCRSWRVLADDNLLWKEKCKQAGIEEIPKKRMSSRSPTHMSPWKATFMRQHTIEMNWRSSPLNRMPKVLKGHDDHVITCLQFCGNRIVSGSDDNTLKVWSATTGKCLRTLVGHTGGVWSSQMSGSTIISGSTDRTLKVWDADTGVCMHTLYGHTSTVRCMHLHGKKVVSGSRDATLRVWDIETGSFLHVLVGHVAAVRCVQYDGRLVVSGAYDFMVKVWNPDTQECLHTLEGHTNRVYSLQFDGVHVVSGSLDTSIRVWEVETGACKHTLMGHQSLTSGMELRNNILVSGNADSTVKVWDIVTGQCLQTLSGPYKHQSAVTCLQFNKRFVITSSDDGTVKLWDVQTGEFIRNLVALDSGGAGGVVWRIRANDTKLVCAVGSRNGTEETKLLVLNFDVESNNSDGTITPSR
ncbi:F-box/WD repeat-containing protein 7 [Diorhabda carinulata]|uniref:F-box/WD repeat-containing protein 7 n=1 Tax=Diorhabda carinulata TaxID=1163345 RepID=UPI0025A2824D|nr:F-box/WD repeat-containing protein 7 [Diorhabda carinulata]